MKRQLKLLVCTWVASSALVGCSKTDETGQAEVAAKMKGPEATAAVIEKTFVATPEDKQAAQVAAQAIKQQDYEAALAAIQTLQSSPARSFEQSQVLNQSMRTLQSQIISGLAKGDPKAKRAAEVLKGQHKR